MKVKLTRLEIALLSCIALVAIVGTAALTIGCNGDEPAVKPVINRFAKEKPKEIVTFTITDFNNGRYASSQFTPGEACAFGFLKKGDATVTILLVDSFNAPFANGDILVLDNVRAGAVRDTSGYGPTRTYTADILGRYDPITKTIMK